MKTTWVHPRSWTGWTSIAILAVLFLAVIVANGAHKTIRSISWLGILVVGAVTIWNTLTGKK